MIEIFKKYANKYSPETTERDLQKLYRTSKKYYKKSLPVINTFVAKNKTTLKKYLMLSIGIGIVTSAIALIVTLFFV